MLYQFEGRNGALPLSIIGCSVTLPVRKNHRVASLPLKK
jgi:hypothetical protein